MFDNMKVLSVQLAIFVHEGFVRPDELSFSIASKMQIGDYEPMLIPEMPGMPNEFPRLQISTPLGYRLTMSKSRIDIFLELPLGLDSDDEKKFLSNCESLIGVLRDKNFIFSRAGFVKLYFLPGATQEYLSDKILKIDSKGVSDINIAITKKVVCAGKVSNNVFAFSNGLDGQGEPGIGVTRDVNTDASQGATLNSDEFLSYLREAYALADLESVKEIFKVS